MKKQSLMEKIENINHAGKKVKYVINSVLCHGCDFCKKNCSAGAIYGEIKQPHKIDWKKCICCGSCESVCPFKAISCQTELLS